MKKSFYLSIITLFGTCMLHSQDPTSTDSIDKPSPLLTNDWSDIGTTPYILGKKTNKTNVESYWNLTKIIDSSTALGSLNYAISAPSNSKMPVHEPKGLHKIRVFKIESTIQFYLKIHKVH